MKTGLALLFGGILSLFLSANAFAEKRLTNALESVNYSVISESETQLDLVMSQVVEQVPRSFTLNNPPRIVLDFPKTSSAIEKQRQVIGLGAINDVLVMEAGGRTRAIIALKTPSSFKTSINGQHIYVVLSRKKDPRNHQVLTPQTLAKVERNTPEHSPTFPEKNKTKAKKAERKISDIDFHKGKGGDGRVIISLSDSHTSVDINKEGSQLVVDFIDTNLPARLDRRFDVADFSTKVQRLDLFVDGKNTRMIVTTEGAYEHSVLQAGNQLSIDIHALEGSAKNQYKGKSISLNIQNIDVRAVLQIILEEMQRNVIISDNVSGSIALRLDNVPVDQALDVVLKTQGLSVQLIGDVMYIGPSKAIVKREQDALQAEQDLAELTQLKNKIIQINYATADEMAALIKSKDASLLSERGSVTTDLRTNTLLIRDTESRISSAETLIKKLDIPIKQVLIESRIVIANKSFNHQLGVAFGVTGATKVGNKNHLVSTATGAGTDSLVSSVIDNIAATGNAFPVVLPSAADRLNVNLPAAATGQIAFALLGPDYLLDLELSAMQAEGNGEVVSTPRVIALDRETATIKQGVQIPFQEASSSGATSISFKEAVLKLSVMPQITPDDSLILEITVSKDSLGGIFGGVPSIQKREVKSKVLVKNGETVVLGGIFEETSSDGLSKVPFLGDLPGVGWMFRNTTKSTTKAELLIFVTPRILKDNLEAATR